MQVHNSLIMTPIQVIFILCSSLVAFGYSTESQNDAALVGPAFCAKGQAAWCQNFTTANSCNAVKHCLQTVWLTQKPATVDGSCGSCEAEIEKIRSGISSNTTKEVLQELLENICDLTFITELFRKRCERYIDQYVDSYFNELLDLLKSDLNPATICKILGFCSSLDSSSLTFEDDNVVRFRNVILHLPADIIDIPASKQLVGASKCTWGPSYWCHNLTSSKECSSLHHCINKVWSKEQYPEDNDSVCKVCKDMVQQARDQLQSNETQEELREVFEGSCKLIPIKEVRTECMKLADDFVPELTEMLVSEMNPTVVCTVAGLCNSQRIDNLLKATAEPADLCTNCTFALTAVKRYFEQAPKSQVLDKLLRLCGQLSSYSETCINVVVSNLDSIFENLSTQMHPFPVCHLSGMCAQNYHQHSPNYGSILQANADTMLATANDDLPCDLCKQLLKHLKDVLTTNTTESEFLDMLRGICQHTKSFKGECLEIVDNNFQKIYKFLTEELNPEEICQEVNLCPKKNAVSDENLQLIDHGALVPAVLTELSIPTQVKTECRLCRLIVGLIQKEMNKPEYEHNIEKLLEKICSLIPRHERSKCDKFIQTYSDALIKLLADQTDPGIICQLLGLCDNLIAVRNELCPICQYVMHFIEEQLQNPDEVQKVEDIVRKVCRIVPDSEKKECQSFINNYAALIMSVLSVELDPSIVCPAIKLCPHMLSPLERCNQCQHLMNDMTKELAHNRSPPKVISALRTFVPARQSDSFMTALQLRINHIDDIVDMMVAEFDAQESCVFMQFCEPNMISSEDASVAEEETNDIAEVAAPLTKPSCELCELMVQLYVDKLTSNATEAEIEAELQKFCVKIKNPNFRSNCSYFVQKYVPKVVKLLKKDVSAEEVCSLVNLCPPKVDLESVALNGGRCEFCEAVVGSLEALSADPQMMTKSMKYLFRICDVFQKPNERTNCMKTISIVGPQLEDIALGIPSWYYCSKMRMCPYGARLSYKQVCSDSSQWCADVTKAMLCGQLSYCQQSEWMSDEPSL